MLTGIFADKTYKHFLTTNLLLVEQKGGQRGSQWTKDHLAIYSAVLQNWKSWLTNLCMSWVDFKKAYDMVPRLWVLKCLKMFGIANNIIAIIESSMPNWRTNRYANNQHLGTVAMKSESFQGNTVSPLLFYNSLETTVSGLEQVRIWIPS